MIPELLSSVPKNATDCPKTLIVMLWWVIIAVACTRNGVHGRTTHCCHLKGLKVGSLAALAVSSWQFHRRVDSTGQFVSSCYCTGWTGKGQ